MYVGSGKIVCVFWMNEQWKVDDGSTGDNAGETGVCVRKNGEGVEDLAGFRGG